MQKKACKPISIPWKSQSCRYLIHSSTYRSLLGCDSQDGSQSFKSQATRDQAKLTVFRVNSKAESHMYNANVTLLQNYNEQICIKQCSQYLSLGYFCLLSIRCFQFSCIYLLEYVFNYLKVPHYNTCKSFTDVLALLSFFIVLFLVRW